MQLSKLSYKETLKINDLQKVHEGHLKSPCGSLGEHQVTFTEGHGSALSNYFVVVGGTAGEVDSKCQVSLPARGLIVKSSVEYCKRQVN